MNLGGARFVERSESRDVVVCVNREGVHSDTIHGSVRTKSQVICAIRQQNSSGDGCAWEGDLHHHHQIMQPESGPSPQPTHLPITEPRAQLHRRAKPKELRFHLHLVFLTLPVVNTFIPLGVRNGKSLPRKRSARSGAAILFLSVNRRPVNQGVIRSNPTWRAKFLRYE